MELWGTIAVVRSGSLIILILSLVPILMNFLIGSKKSACIPLPQRISHSGQTFSKDLEMFHTEARANQRKTRF